MPEVATASQVTQGAYSAHGSASEARDAARPAESGAGREAVEGREAAEAREAPSGLERQTELDLSQVGQLEGWSPEDFGQSANELLRVDSVESEDLIGSEGQVTDRLRPEEKAHYDQIGLEPEKVGGRECLVRDDIDWSQTDAYGESNLERAERGLAPLDPNGESYELHHVQQRNDGVLAELTQDEHRAPDIDRVLHDRQGPSEIDRDAFADIRANHWRERAASAREELGL